MSLTKKELKKIKEDGWTLPTHTPTPWGRTSYPNGLMPEGMIGIGVTLENLALVETRHGIDRGNANADYIIRAVNNYERLASSHEELLRLVKEVERWIMVNYYGAVPFLDDLTSAIAKAEGRE